VGERISCTEFHAGIPALKEFSFSFVPATATAVQSCLFDGKRDLAITR
jgi:hypothetical protein